MEYFGSVSQLGDASTQLRDASTQLGDASNFTLKYSSIFDKASSQLGDAPTQLDDASTQLGERVPSTSRQVKNATMAPMAYHTGKHINFTHCTLHTLALL